MKTRWLSWKFVVGFKATTAVVVATKGIPHVEISSTSKKEEYAYLLNKTDDATTDGLEC